ncbi:MAG: ribosome maturation factor [Saprospiraceae bacterium]|nr:ribosome maturation factor [Saprospiraceae bacterium]MBK9994232.1 ribosome maturation factor [Saprospiraceae bacterium]
MFTEEIENLLTEKFKEEGFLDCFLVEIEQNGKHLGVFMDSDSPLSFDRCKEVSRIVEAFLDDKKYLGEDYLLEVSSPGIDRPLKFPRQFIKNIGRNIIVRYGTEERAEGVLTSADEEKITVSWEEIYKEDKKKIKKNMQVSIEYKLIHEAKIQIKL